MKLKNIPNILSVIRIILVAVFVYTSFCVSDTVALIVFLAAGATDVVDGYPPNIVAFFETEEAKREFEEWKKAQEKQNKIQKKDV